MILIYCEYCEDQVITLDCMKNVNICGACYIDGKHLCDV